MRLRVLVLALATTVLAQTENPGRPARTPQGQIRYDDPNGSKVNWKFYAPYNQWRTHLENPQRAQRAETASTQPQTPLAQQQQHQQQQHQQHQQQHQQQQHQQQQQHRLVQSHQPAPISNTVPTQPEYKPYSSAPSHIKQLILQAYEPQRPYVDPSSFLYEASLPPQEVLSPVDHSRSSQYESSASRYPTAEDTKAAPTNAYYDDRMAKLQGRIDYKEDYEHQTQQQQEQQVPSIIVPIETMPVQPPPKLVIDKNMPQEIQQLLHYQAQIPYDVIANKITYRPKTLFIPKPISDDSKGPYYYKSKVYFMKDDNIDDVVDSKLLEESQHH